jgi:hypothetical protein
MEEVWWVVVVQLLESHVNRFAQWASQTGQRLGLGRWGWPLGEANTARRSRALWTVQKLLGGMARDLSAEPAAVMLL